MQAKTYSTLSTILSLIAISSSDNFQVVDHGPCLNGVTNYCQERVKNSYCSKMTNKCFCQSNYVAIRDRDSITCKPLLSDLKCGMDQDCTEIYNSICHPGASECTCPAQTFYVPASHSCESESFSSNSICNQCKNVGGKCYLGNSNISILDQFSNKKKNLCLCPGITIFNEIQQENEEIMLQCNKIWVDIGHICDNATRICKSLKSTCVMNEIAGYGICQCYKNHWPVYQKNLNFHECYPEQFDYIQKNCKLCKQIDGACINMNEDSTTDGCVCPISRKLFLYDNIIRKPSEIISTVKCVTTNEMVDVKCDMNKFLVCIHINENEFPVLVENVRKNLSRIFFSDRIIPNARFSLNVIQKEIDHQCYFSPMTSVFNSNFKFCQSLVYDEKQGKFPCGINTIQYMNGYFYSGYVELWNNIHVPNVLADKLFDVSCKSINIRVVDTIGQAIDRSWPLTSYQIISREFQTDSQFLSFTVVDVNNRYNDYFTKLASIRLQAKMNPNTTSFKHISADLCWVQNTSHFIPHQTERWNIINRGCAIKDSGFTTHFLPVYDTPTITSALFPLFQISNNQYIFFKCIFRLCTNPTWCKTDYDCSNYVDRTYPLDPPPLNIHDITYITKSIVVSVGLQKPFQSDSRLKNNLSECTYFWCVTKLKLAIISMIIGGIVLLAAAVFLLLCYRQKVIRDINRCQRLSSRPLNVNTLNRQHHLNVLPSAKYNPSDCASYMLVTVGHRAHQCQPLSLNFDSSDMFETPCFVNSSACTVNHDSDIGNDLMPPYSSNCHGEIITINNSGENI